jgi:glycosyltransferase involved in cell wall biosynthesis
MKYSIQTNATLGLATSREAAVELFGEHWENDPRWSILHCGIDLTSFMTESINRELRKEFGIGDTEFVLGHIGRFESVKNHHLLIEITRILRERGEHIRLLLIGDGQLRPSIEQQVNKYHLEDCVIFAGIRNDVPRLLNNVIDIFVMPSFYEGLSLVYLEAQAAGIPSILSKGIPMEANVVPGLSQRLSVEDTPSRWADAIMAKLKNISKPPRREALGRMIDSDFNITNSTNNLASIYTGTY